MTRSPKLLTGGASSVAQLFPLWGSGRPTRFWAEHGRVNWIDERDGTVGSLDWRDAAQRVLGLSEMVFKSHEEGHYSDETRKIQRYISEMEDVIRKAKEQAQPAKSKPQTVVTPLATVAW